MKILICSDSFKHSMTALEACTSLAEGISSMGEDHEMDLVPLADGGEGTVRALVDATRGRIIDCVVHNPHMKKIKAQLGILGKGETAVIEMAAASGIELIPSHESNPLFTTSYGTGELIRQALDQGCKKIILGIGGSATIDGGAGLLAALGARFYDKNHQPILPTGEKLNEIHAVDTQSLDKRLGETEIHIACDVDNPLTGEQGAAYVYGPQKGARPEDLPILDNNLKEYAGLLSRYTSTDLIHKPGTGAAGGLAISLLAFTRATLNKGFDLIARELNLEPKIKASGLIITGEGKLDAQTAYGKTPYGVASLAQKYNKPVIAVTGSLEKGNHHDFDLILPILEKPTDLQEALQNGQGLLKSTGKRIAQIILLSERL
jgi:glycerate kinase